MTETVLLAWFWFGFCVAVAFFAARYGRSGFGWFILSMILSPLLGFVFVLALGRRTTA
jgi:hypothetical protein